RPAGRLTTHDSREDSDGRDGRKPPPRRFHSVRSARPGRGRALQPQRRLPRPDRGGRHGRPDHGRFLARPPPGAPARAQATPPPVVQVRRGGPRGGGSGRDRGNGKGDDRGDDRKPENGDSNDRPRDRDNRRNGNRYDLDLELEGGQGRQQDEQGRSASNGFPL